MKKIIMATILGVMILTFTLSGCMFLHGSSGTLQKNVPTIGQQLIDLQKAKESGAITEEEY